MIGWSRINKTAMFCLSSLALLATSYRTESAKQNACSTTFLAPEILLNQSGTSQLPECLGLYVLGPSDPVEGLLGLDQTRAYVFSVEKNSIVTADDALWEKGDGYRYPMERTSIMLLKDVKDMPYPIRLEMIKLPNASEIISETSNIYLDINDRLLSISFTHKSNLTPKTSYVALDVKATNGSQVGLVVLVYSPEPLEDGKWGTLLDESSNFNSSIDTTDDGQLAAFFLRGIENSQISIEIQKNLPLIKKKLDSAGSHP